MFDRLSSLVVALTLVTVAVILAALAGGDALTIAILALAGIAAAAIVYGALPSQLPEPQSHVMAETAPASLLHHPDFALWVDQEKEPLIGISGNVVTRCTQAGGS